MVGVGVDVGIGIGCRFTGWEVSRCVLVYSCSLSLAPTDC